MTEDEGFKITDRRGRPSDGSTAEPEGRPLDSGARPAAGPPPGAAEAHPPRAGGPPGGGPDLQGLFVMFASSALINLGEAPDPATGERSVDLEQARETIDVLVLIRDKTEGNRTEQESRLLEEILYDLQLRFVSAARSP